MRTEESGGPVPAGVAPHHVGLVLGHLHDLHEPHVGEWISHGGPVGVGVDPVVLSVLVVTSHQYQSPGLGAALVEDCAGSVLEISQIQQFIFIVYVLT